MALSILRAIDMILSIFRVQEIDTSANVGIYSWNLLKLMKLK